MKGFFLERIPCNCFVVDVSTFPSKSSSNVQLIFVYCSGSFRKRTHAPYYASGLTSRKSGVTQCIIDLHAFFCVRTTTAIINVGLVFLSCGVQYSRSARHPIQKRTLTVTFRCVHSHLTRRLGLIMNLALWQITQTTNEISGSSPQATGC